MSLKNLSDQALVLRYCGVEKTLKPNETIEGIPEQEEIRLMGEHPNILVKGAELPAKSEEPPKEKPAKKKR